MIAIEAARLVAPHSKLGILSHSLCPRGQYAPVVLSQLGSANEMEGETPRRLASRVGHIVVP